MPPVTRAVLVATGVFGFICTAAANPPQPPLPVHIALRDHGFGFRDIAIRSPAVRFEIVNDGSAPHGFAIAGTGHATQGVKVALPPLAPGQKTQVTLSLPAGRYELYSPVDGDREHGLAVPMRFVHPYGSGTEMNRVFYNYAG